MPYLTGNQRTRAYGSYNSKKNSFMLSTINNGSCWIPRQARCQAPCGITFPKWKSSEHPDGIPWDEELYKSLVQGRQNAIKNTDNKRISGTVRVSSSEYQMNKASGLSTQNLIFNKHQPKPGYDRDDLKLLQWNQSSDRSFPSRFNKMMKVNVPSHGNSTKTSLTRHRPGAGAGGKQAGVDLKHNSYHRYLLKKKGLKPLRGEKQKVDPWKDPKPHQSKAVFEKAIQNNKWRKDSIVANMNFCYEKDCKPKPAPVPEPEVKPEDLLIPVAGEWMTNLNLDGKGTKDEPYIGKSTNTKSTGDEFRDFTVSRFSQSTASVRFLAVHPCQVTVNIESSSEENFDAVFLLKNNEIISLGSENTGNLTGKFLNDIPKPVYASPNFESATPRIAFVNAYGKSGNNQVTKTTLVLGAGDEITIIYDKDYNRSYYEDAITMHTVYAEPLTSHKELPKSIVQEQDFFKTSLKEVKPEKSPADFFDIKKDFDYIIKPNNKVERIIENYSEVSFIITDLNHVEEVYVNGAHISYLDPLGKEIKIPLKDLVNGVKLKSQNPVSIKFRTDLASFDAIYEDNKWVCNPPISKQKDEIFIFDMLQNLTLVAQVNK